jgi:hypothetical protein
MEHPQQGVDQRADDLRRLGARPPARQSEDAAEIVQTGSSPREVVGEELASRVHVTPLSFRACGGAQNQPRKTVRRRSSWSLPPMLFRAVKPFRAGSSSDGAEGSDRSVDS